MELNQRFMDEFVNLIDLACNYWDRNGTDTASALRRALKEAIEEDKRWLTSIEGTASPVLSLAGLFGTLFGDHQVDRNDPDQVAEMWSTLETCLSYTDRS